MWVIAGQLAVCERLGGVGDAHRKVRRQQELRWLANQGVASVLAVCADSPPFGDYDRAGIAWMHRPLTAGPVGDVYAGLADCEMPVVVHGNTVNETVVGFVAGVLLLRGCAADAPSATAIVERLTGRPLGSGGAAVLARAASVVAR